MTGQYNEHNQKLLEKELALMKKEICQLQLRMQKHEWEAHMPPVIREHGNMIIEHVYQLNTAYLGILTPVGDKTIWLITNQRYDTEDIAMGIVKMPGFVTWGEIKLELLKKWSKRENFKDLIWGEVVPRALYHDLLPCSLKKLLFATDLVKYFHC